MKFSEIIGQAIELLQRKGRLSYRTLKLEFDLNDEQLEALREELIEVQELAIDEDGKMLVWVGNTEEDPGKRIRITGEMGKRKATTRAAGRLRI